MKNQESKPFGNMKTAKVLVIGHDPRLQISDTIAQYCFFADYFFRPIPKAPAELSKYKLAESLFSYMGWLTSYKFTAAEYFITNLCNQSLDHSPAKKTVLIPETIAKEGIARIKSNIEEADFKLILPMSQQVNFWMQYFNFYTSSEEYLKSSKPKQKGLYNNYYEPEGKSPFLMICGEKYFYKDIPIVPILHVKQYPLKGRIKDNYLPLLNKGREFILGI